MQFYKQKCGNCSQLMNEKVKKNPKIPPVHVTGGHFELVVLSTIKVN